MLDKYPNFADVFSLKWAVELPKHTTINDHAIELVDDWQPLYNLIYNLEPIELETLKIYIKNNLANGFIRPSKFFTRAIIFFDKKPTSSLRLCMDNQGLNNLTIKNWYPLPLVWESLDWLSWAWRFSQLDLTNTYYWMRIRKSSEWKTTFRNGSDPFKYQVMLFGLTNTPAIFKSYINNFLAEKLDVFVIVYLDNIFIYIESKSIG